jgi:hypothetical protein
MDVHKIYLQVAVLDEKGKVLNNSRVDNNLIKVNGFFDTVHSGNNAIIVSASRHAIYTAALLFHQRPL